MASITLQKHAKKTFEVGGQGFRSDTRHLLFDLDTVAIDDVEAMMHQITQAELEEQRHLDNIPQRIVVDNRDHLDYHRAQKDVIVYFDGAVVGRAVMSHITDELMSNIKKALQGRPGQSKSTGALATASNWQWFHIPYEGIGGYGAAQKVGLQDVSMTVNDLLILMPKDVIFYSTVVAQRLTHSSPTRGGVYKSGKRKGQQRSDKHESFLKRTTDSVKRKSFFKGLSIGVGFTSSHGLPHEVRGTGRTSKVGMPITSYIYVKATARGR